MWACTAGWAKRLWQTCAIWTFSDLALDPHSIPPKNKQALRQQFESSSSMTSTVGNADDEVAAAAMQHYTASPSGYSTTIIIIIIIIAERVLNRPLINSH